MITYSIGVILECTTIEVLWNLFNIEHKVYSVGMSQGRIPWFEFYTKVITHIESFQMSIYSRISNIQSPKKNKKNKKIKKRDIQEMVLKYKNRELKEGLMTKNIL